MKLRCLQLLALTAVQAALMTALWGAVPQQFTGERHDLTHAPNGIRAMQPSAGGAH